jgi:pimeloyl-ACP methyl ester carboxylesterase
MDSIARCIEKREEMATSPLLEEIWDLATPDGNHSEATGQLNLLANLRPVYRTPILISHSKDDEVVPVANGARLSSCLSYIFMDVYYKTYEDGGHWVNEPQGVDDMVEFLKCKVLSS